VALAEKRATEQGEGLFRSFCSRDKLAPLAQSFAVGTKETLMPADSFDIRSDEWNATSYHRLSNPQFSWGKKILERLELRGDEEVLDAGCGTGRLTAELLERLPRGRVIAVDRSENMLRTASQYLASRFGDRVKFIRADLQTLQIDESVDGVFSTATFHWIPDHPLLFRHLYRTLKPGGWLVAQCGGESNLSCLLKRAGRLMATEPYARFFSDWSSPWEYADDVITAKRLRASGFVSVQTSLEPAPTVLGGAQEYREFITNVVFREHLTRVPDDKLRAKFVATLTEQAAGDDPPFLIDYWRLNLRGERPGQGH
jgi:trans-aconitate 2-methyltransferase